MAKNREPVPEPEPEESIGTEEEEESSEEEEEEEEEGSEDERSLPKTRSHNTTPQKIPPPASSSEDEEDDDNDAESDSDSDGPAPKPDPSVKPIASKPMVDEAPKSVSAAASGTRRARSQPGPSGPTSPTKSGVKRPAEKDNEAKDTKKSKKKPDTAAEGGEVSEKKTPQLFQRLWSEEDEIVILKGMMDYAAKKKADPVSDIGAFLEFIKKSLHIDVTKTQLQDKIRRLKKKYENNASKEKNGKERTFSKPHEQAAYELSKKIWGSVSENNGHVGGEKVPETPKAVTGGVVRKSRSKNVVAMTPNKFNEVEDKDMKDVEVEDNVEGLKKNGNVVGGGRLGGDSGYLSLADWIMNDGAKMVEDAKREEMEEKWRKIKEQEVEVFLKRSELMCEQARLVLEALRKSEH